MYLQSQVASDLPNYLGGLLEQHLCLLQSNQLRKEIAFGTKLRKFSKKKKKKKENFSFKKIKFDYKSVKKVLIFKIIAVQAYWVLVFILIKITNKICLVLIQNQIKQKTTTNKINFKKKIKQKIVYKPLSSALVSTLLFSLAGRSLAGTRGSCIEDNVVTPRLLCTTKPFKKYIFYKK